MSMEKKIKYVSSILQSPPDMELFQRNKPCMALIRKGRVAAIPTDQCHLAASDDDTLVITPNAQNAAYMHVVCRKPIWLYDKAADIRDISKSAKETAEYVIIVCRPEEERLVRKYVEEWARIKPGIATAAYTPEQEISEFNKHFKAI